jgi:hypothetical protein
LHLPTFCNRKTFELSVFRTKVIMHTASISRTWAFATEVFREAMYLFRPQPERQASRPLPQRRNALEQWSRVAGVLAEAQCRAHRALECHKGASAQLDAATYALQRLHEEMSPAFFFTLSREVPPAAIPTAFRREQFRRREPLAA